MSMNKITELLKKANIPSPSNKPTWGRQIIDNVLSNEKYMGTDEYPQIISLELFSEVRIERNRRRKRKKFNTSNLFTGLLYCEGGGKTYRRIPRSHGEVVWRCANRVEHGKKYCKSSPTIFETDLIEKLSNQLVVDQRINGVDELSGRIRDIIDSIVICEDGALHVYFKENQKTRGRRSNHTSQKER